MPTIETLTVDIEARTSKFSKGLKLATAGLAALGAGAVVSINKASDLEESMSKVGVVFGKSAEGVVDWSKTSATAMGQSQQQALEAAGTFGNLFTAMDVGQKPAAAMSQQLVQLAGDLASFNNADPKEVLENLRSGLVGEAEPLRKFGVQLSAARIEQEAMRQGLEKVDGEFTAAAKAQAAYAIILDDTAKAQGDFARTSDSAANQQRILRAEMDNLLARIGGFLLPVAKELLSALLSVADALGRVLGPALQAVGDWIQRVWERAKPVADIFGGLLAESLSKVWNIIQTNLWPALQRLWEALQPILKVLGVIVGVALAGLIAALPVVVRLLAGVVSALAGVVGAIGNVITWIGKAIVWIRDRFVGAWQKLREVAVGIWSSIKTVALNVLNTVVGFFTKAINWIIERINDVIGALNALPGVDIPTIGLIGGGATAANVGSAFASVGNTVAAAVRVDLRVDRKRFVDGLTRDAAFRGW